MKQNRFLKTQGGLFLAAIVANLFWGSAAPAIKLGYRLFQISSDAPMSQILFAGVRFMIAGILTILLGSILERRLLYPNRNSGGMLLLLALTQTILQYVFFYLGLSVAPGYKGSVLSASSVFFSVLLSSLVFRQETLTARKLLGCLIGFSGVILVSVQNVSDGAAFRWNGEGFLLLSALSAACSTALIKSFSRWENPVTLSGYQFLLGGTVMALIGAASGGALQPITHGAWLLMLYLGILSAVAYTIWSLLLQIHPVSRVTVFVFINPVFGVLLSAFLLGEGSQLNLPRCLLSLLLVSVGIWVVNRTKQSKPIQSGIKE